MDIKKLKNFSDDDLVFIRELLSSDNNVIINEIDKIIEDRTKVYDQNGIKLNQMFSIDELNIDQAFKDRLKQNGVTNMQQLLDADLSSFSVEGSEARNQYEYAREMFDFRQSNSKKR